MLMEAMASGVPVIATQIAGIPELVEHGKSGLLVPPGDSGALTDAIENLMANGALRDRLGHAGRATVEQEFNAQREAAWLKEIMTLALQGKIAPVRPTEPPKAASPRTPGANSCL